MQVIARFDGGRVISKVTHVMVGDRIQLLRGCGTQGFNSVLAVARGCPQFLDVWTPPCGRSQAGSWLHQREQARSSEEEC